jgi:hypothetical protein
MRCPFCLTLIDVANVGAVLVETGEPLVRCHACTKILRVDFVEGEEFAEKDPKRGTNRV